jgi:alpha 1,2-mannosyltransferase
MEEDFMSKQKAAIVYLTRQKDILDLKKSLFLLDAHFNKQFKYPIIIFHEDLTKGMMCDLKSVSKSKIIFEKLTFKFKPGVDQTKFPKKYLGFSINYRHMCRFFSMGIYEQKIMDKYDWYWRLDTDSFILDTINYDVFEFMAKNKIMYGYNHIAVDSKELTIDLKKTFDEYVLKKKIVPKSLSRLVPFGIWFGQFFYTNFTITNTAFWKSKKVKDFLDYIDKSGGIYKYRWGDTPIHFLTAALFLDIKQIHCFNDIFYKHQDIVIFPEKFKRKSFFVRGLKFCKNKIHQ